METPWSFKYLIPLLKAVFESEERSITIYPSFLLDMLAFKILNKRSNFFVNWQTIAFCATTGGKFKITILEYNFSLHNIILCKLFSLTRNKIMYYCLQGQEISLIFVYIINLADKQCCFPLCYWHFVRRNFTYE